MCLPSSGQGVSDRPRDTTKPCRPGVELTRMLPRAAAVARRCFLFLVLEVLVLGLDVDARLGDHRQQLVRLAFLIEGLLQDARLLVETELPGVRAYRTVS